MIDCHVHTNFSSDGTASPEAMVLAAIEQGAHVIALTDHLDLDKTGTIDKRMRDIAQYHRTLSELKQRYADKIFVAVGLECGYAPETQQIIADHIGGFRFDYIINSVHDVNGEDVYRQSFFASRGKQKSYADYLTAVLESLDAVYPFDAIGHLCYPERVAPFPDPAMRYEEFGDLFNAIFDKIILKKKILELNTSTAKLPTPCIPRAEVLSKYKERGGTRITFSSDAHGTNRVGDKYAEVCALAKKLGFRYFTYIRNGEEQREHL